MTVVGTEARTAGGENPAPGLPGRWRRIEPARSFVGSTLQEDGSVTILLLGRCDRETTARVAEHIDLALDGGARHLTVEVIGRLDDRSGLCALLGRTQTRVAGRCGLLVAHGVPPVDTGPGNGTRAPR